MRLLPTVSWYVTILLWAHVDDCDVEGSLRLVGGSNETEGVVEICRDGVWGTVCDEQWDESAAQVACKQLGFVSAGECSSVSVCIDLLHCTGAVAHSSDVFGVGIGPVHITNIQCHGNETNLIQCTNELEMISDNSSCGHDRDSGLTCPGNELLCACYCIQINLL